MTPDEFLGNVIGDLSSRRGFAGSRLGNIPKRAIPPSARQPGRGSFVRVGAAHFLCVVRYSANL